MKLVGYELGQVLQIIRMDEMRALSGAYVPDLLGAIKDRYRFIGTPDLTVAGLAEGMKFEIGTFNKSDRQIAIKSLGIYTDGILVGCWNTEDADFITDDLLDWSIKTFGLRRPTTRIPRKYVSHVIVDFDASIDRLVLAFSTIARTYEAALETETGTKTDIHLNKFVLSSDPASGTPPTQTSFSIEPRVNVPYADMRYFSTAALTTAGHLKFLAALEEALGR
jgi:hypothetical protein